MLNDTFISVSEASSFLKISVPTLYGWVHREKIPFRKHGRKLVFLKADLEKWSEANAVPTNNSSDFQRSRVNHHGNNRREVKFTSVCSLKTKCTADQEPSSLQKEESNGN